MANVISELFKDIADSIRYKTGETGTMKPAEFPAEIMSIVTGGGSSGGESGGGSGSTDVREVWLSESGTFTPEESTYTVEHSLGKIPDVIYFKIDLGFSTFTESAGFYVLSFFAMSDNLLGGAVNVGGKKAHRGMTYFYNPSNGQFGTGLLTNGIENLAANDFIHATDTSIRFGEANLLLSKKYAYSWGAYAKRKLEGNTEDLIKYVTFIGGNGEELCKVPVVIGDDCADPVANGTIQTPTKESTVDKVFTFSGWSLTEGGTASSGALKNITADKTVYVAFTEKVRTYTVSFYDGATLVKTEQIAYGGSSSYTYRKDNYIFNGWEPTPTNITGHLKCYAQLEESYTFANASWDKIVEYCERGVANQTFALGDTKTITLRNYDDSSQTVDVDVQIIAFSYHDLADGSGKTYMTLMSVPSLRWGVSSPDLGSGVACGLNNNWGTLQSDFKKYAAYVLNNQFYEKCLPSDLKSHIKLVTLNTSYGIKNVDTNDHVFVPSNRGLGNIPNYDYFKNVYGNERNTRRKKLLLDGTESEYGLRDGTISYSGNYAVTKDGDVFYIQPDGESKRYFVGANFGIFPFCFCI